MADLEKGRRITGTARNTLASELAKKYEKGASIRALAESTGRFLRLRAPGALRVRCDTAQPRRRPPDEEGVNPLGVHRSPTVRPEVGAAGSTTHRRAAETAQRRPRTAQALTATDDSPRKACPMVG
jgi:hypothetical protein